MIRRKHRLWTRWREKQTVEAEQAYKKQRNLVRKESRRLERKQQCEVAKTCKTKPKKFQKYVRSKRENRGGIGDIKAKDEQGNEVTITEDKEKAEMFVRYFSANHLDKFLQLRSVCQCRIYMSHESRLRQN